jgi:hypothetical protein
MSLVLRSSSSRLVPRPSSTTCLRAYRWRERVMHFIHIHIYTLTTPHAHVHIHTHHTQHTACTCTHTHALISLHCILRTHIHTHIITLHYTSHIHNHIITLHFTHTHTHHSTSFHYTTLYPPTEFRAALIPQKPLLQPALLGLPFDFHPESAQHTRGLRSRPLRGWGGLCVRGSCW